MNTPLTSGLVGDKLADLHALRIGSLERLWGIVQADCQNFLANDLRMSASQMTSMVNAIKPHVPTSVQATGPSRRYSMGCLPPVAAQGNGGSNTQRASASPQVKASPSVNLIPKLPPIRAQGYRGTCVAFAASALHDYDSNGQPSVYSEQFLYYACKQLDGDTKCGTHLQQATVVLGAQGQCLDQDFPYNGNNPCHDPTQPSSRNIADAANHLITLTEIAATSVPDIKSCIASRGPVAVSIPVYNSWYQSPAVEIDGAITMPLNSETVREGHAVCLVGYDDDANEPGGGRFIVRNSWSTNWAYSSPYGAGYGSIPYAYIAGYTWEAYGL